ncbi:unnamed protein product [Orchesella dallaii]|uniref:Mitochondrial inner membrane protease subunit 2 n=1 Tax=Orchesella dallaii TaxID=48710 RepID=A0ABP1QYD4_9HEXA
MFSFSALKFVVKGFAIGIPAGITIIDLIGYVAKVEGSSMQPLLNPDNSPATASDYVFLHNWPIISNGYNEIERGEIIALISPRDPKQRLIKRVIGVPGDIIETSGSTKKYVRVPQGHLWVEGDHRGRSYDSTIFGPVALGLVKSKARAIVWPPYRWQLLQPYMLPDRVPVNLQSKTISEVTEFLALTNVETKPPIY